MKWIILIAFTLLVSCTTDRTSELYMHQYDPAYKEHITVYTIDILNYHKGDTIYIQHTKYIIDTIVTTPTHE